MLKGEAIHFLEANGKNGEVVLKTPNSRRIYDFLRRSDVRDAKDLQTDFIEGLWAAYDHGDDPAADQGPQETGEAEQPRIWRIAEIQTTNFGGLNVWGGPSFTWSVNGASWLLDGANGSGKSSLLGAVVWACTGYRPRDEATTPAHVHAPVLDSQDEKIGTWPPLACYPDSAEAIAGSPEVEVRVTFADELTGENAVISRALRGGKVHESWAPALKVHDVFLNTGIAMPVALSSLRLTDKDGDGALTRAVAQLTGLDELAELGDLCSGLSNAGREYASYAKKAGLAQKESSFREKLTSAAKELAQIGEVLPNFHPSDALGKSGPMVKLGIQLKDVAAHHASTLASDLADGTETSSTESQRAIIVALTAVASKLDAGLQSVAFWKDLSELANALTPEVCISIRGALLAAETELAEALGSHERQKNDTRFRMKAAAAEWHVRHREGDILECPLCSQRLDLLPALQQELQSLKTAGTVAQLTLQQSVTQIRETLLTALPDSVEEFVRDHDIQEPRLVMCESFREVFGSGAKHGRLLTKLCQLVNEALESAPPDELLIAAGPVMKFAAIEHKQLVSLFRKIEWCLDLQQWHHATAARWEAWWSALDAGPATEPLQHNPSELRAASRAESLRQHVARLSKAMDSAKPYAQAAEYLRDAVKLGREISGIQGEHERRAKVIEAIQPLKLLTTLSQAVARQAIGDLSGRIRRILEDMHVSERFHYRTAKLQKREGLVVRGSFDGDLQVDATLIANTSWLRSALWAFIFALREEAVEQYGGDPLPVWLFDDPQTTFDLAHRYNWASYVASLQKTAPAAQVIIATHDETFAARLRQSELHAREGLIKGASPDSGALAVLEGSSVDRCWKVADANRSSTKAAVDYLVDARTYLEGMLRAMLAGQGGDIGGFSITQLRKRMEELGRQGRAPWDKQCFSELAQILKKTAIDYLNEAHHATRAQLTYAEAKGFNVIWPNLFKVLNQCYRDIRDYRLLHGMPSAFHLSEPAIDFPEGFSEVVKRKSLSLLGRASAFSRGISEGSLTYEPYDDMPRPEVRLAQHSAYRLAASTLEPVARPGDILLVHNLSEPQSKALVVAIAEQKILARRFVVSDASSNVAVLTANALDPVEIASPVVARRESIKLRRVVGVLFDRAHSVTPSMDREVTACAGEAEVQAILTRCAGLVEVNGQSAQPLALDGQHILVGAQVKNRTELGRLDGLPVIALDSDQRRYFKRLRLVSGGLVILESLDGGGDYPPEVMWEPGNEGKRVIEEVWEVLGVLFERPDQ
ncbi:ATP-binding protein [Eleftheria terrae]|uniref:ATP-binding protein n=1 Tax=Eleftheria terrae TaxID=1597781 RepID=UPI00263BD0B1|nr:ATP-binding protein [Eleftheria terrae]WKB50830.1 ATP-binding protein [Eleftheria terrae]